MKILKTFKIGFFEIVIVFFFFLLASSLYFFLFRTKKDVIVVTKVYEDNIVWDGRKTSWESGAAVSTVWLSDLFHKGMKEKDAIGKASAEILNVRKYDNRPDSPTVYLTLRLKAVYSPGAKIYTYKGKNVLVGSTIQLFLDNVFVEALIVNTEGSKEKFPLVKLSVKAQLANPESGGVAPYIADNILEGTKIKDSKNEDVLTVLKKTVEPAQKLVTTDLGEIVLSRDPYRKDVYLTLLISAYKIQDRYYFFDDIPIRIDKFIPIHFKNISIYPVITQMQEVK